MNDLGSPRMVGGENPSRGELVTSFETKGASLDIKSKRGRSSLRFEQEAIEKFSLAHPEYRFIETPKDRPAAVDGVFMKGGVINSVVEVKTRNVTNEEMRNRFENKWLVTADKIDAGRAAGSLLGVPFVGLLYLIPDETLLALRITNERGEWAFRFERKETTTQKTINGGQVERVNAFLPLATAREIA